MLPQVDGYRVSELLHEGPKTSVFRALRLGDERPVIIKIHTEEYPSARDLAAFEHAFALGERLSDCDGVIKHLELVKERSELALVTEDVGAASMDTLIGPRGLRLDRAVALGTELAEALGQLHDAGVVHRDIKPHNVVVNSESGALKVIDLGIASRLERENVGSSAPRRLQGTLAYMSPEQTGRMNRVVDYRTDLYSLGVTLFEMLTGKLPFDATDPMELVHSHIAKRPPEVRQVNEAVPEMLSAMVGRLLAKNAEDRYMSAHGVARDLARCAEELTRGATIAEFELGADDVSPRFQIPQKLYGRESEVGELLEAYDAASEGGREVLLVSGYSGIGKSALIHEVCKPIVARRGYFCAGKFDQFRRDLPYEALIFAFRDLLRQLLTEREELVEVFRATLREKLGANAGVVTNVIPELEHVIGEQPEPEELGPVEAQVRFNRVFQQFVRVFAQPEHPLAIFIDDLQWADLASLTMLQVLITDPECRHLIIIGAYRNNEVSDGHPLLDTLAGITDEGQAIRNIELTPLARATVAQLVGDTLYQTPEAVAELAQLVHAKTSGNPFFVNQLLERLYDQEHIRFDGEQVQWVWDLDEIRRVEITDNVADLMEQRVAELPEETRRVLLTASCIGAGFDLQTIAWANDRSRGETARALDQALLEGLVLPLDDEYRYVEAMSRVAARGGETDTDANPRYRFLHDRVQQAAHAMLPEDDRKALHYSIGMMIHERCPEEELDENVIDIIDHLLEATDLIVEPAERMAVARLAAMAAERAKESLALDPARTYARLGLEMLPESSWDSHYELTLGLHEEAAEIAFMGLHYKELDELAATTVAHARDLLDKVNVQVMRIGALGSQNEYGKALDVGLEVLAEFGLKVPRHAKVPHILASVVKLKFALRGKSVPGLIDLPEMTDRHTLATMYVLERVAPTAYWAAPNVVPILCFEMCRLSIRHGNTANSPYGYAIAGFMLGGVLGDITLGYALGQLAMALLDSRGERRLVGKTGFIFDAFIRHLKEPMRRSAEAMTRDYQDALNYGDVEYAMYSAVTGLYADILCGRPIATLLKQYETRIRMMRSTRQAQTVTVLDNWHQLLLSLSDPNWQTGRLAGELIDFDECVPTYEKDELHLPLLQGYIVDGMLRYWWGDPEEAARRLDNARGRFEAGHGQTFLAPALVFDGLAHCALARKTSGAAARKHLKSVNSALKQLRKWEEHSPENQRHNVWLVEAERLRAVGDTGACVDAFQEAIKAARDQGFVHVEALACQLLAEHYGEREYEDLADFYIARAGRLYERWGAHALVNRLHDLYPARMQRANAAPVTRVGAQARAGTATTQTVGTTGAALDFGSVMKFVATLSGEIELARLTDQVMSIVLENAGADLGALILDDRGELEIVAAQALEKDTLHFDAGALTGGGSFPKSVTDYVLRTGQSVVLEDACGDELFHKDAYITSHKPRSVLCAPLVKQGELIGLVYLENNLAPGAFTPERVSVVETLCGQAAVSIENARLYEHQKRMAESFSRFVPAQFIHHLGKRSLLDVGLGDSVKGDISVLFSDLRGFTALSEKLGAEESFALLNSYLARMGPCITSNDGFVDKYIGDAVMALFPRCADDAVAAALAMQAALREFNSQQDGRGDQSLTMGIGVHTGAMMLGTVGSTLRMETTVIGDAVNLGSRIEGMTKMYGAGVLITEDTRDALSVDFEAGLRMVGRVRVKGKLEPTTVYEIIDGDPVLHEDKAATLATFRDATERYYAREFDAAMRLFGECVASCHEDVLARHYVARCEKMLLTTVPADWDGVDVLTSK